MDFKSFAQMEQAAGQYRNEVVRLGCALLFIVGVLIYVGLHFRDVPQNYLLIAAAVIGGYMAMNIGANDVANNVGPAVGSKTLTLAGAILLAVIFESMGAIIAGGDVVGTIKKGIIDPALVNDPQQFTWLMMGALLAGAVWLNLATYFGMPVSTTHSIVGGVLGAGIAAGGLEVANWSKLGAIVASWVVSPVFGGVIAALFLYFIKRNITYRSDVIGAARKWVPVLIAVMAWAFSTYLVMKGLKKIWKTDLITALAIGAAMGGVFYVLARQWILRKSQNIEAGKPGLNQLFIVPLICGAALLSFAHGANDVANAVGPLAAVYDTIVTGAVASKAAIPFWVMVIGAAGISVGLALFGPKLIRTVGSEITELDQTRAFCIAIAAAITVIIATQLGLPVSSTHTALGAVFGVGFLRESMKANYARVLDDIREHHQDAPEEQLEQFLKEFEAADFHDKGEMLRELKARGPRTSEGGQSLMTKSERKGLKKVYRKELVKRSMVAKIVSAWIITVPLSALLGAMFFFTFRGMLLP